MALLLTQLFTLHDVTKLRRAVAEQAENSGLRDGRLEDFVLAVHESVVNAVEHAGGRGHLTLWTVDGVIRSETADQGAGIPQAYLDGAVRPADLTCTGRGIYLIRRLCDLADFRTGPDGTTVRLTMRLPHAPALPRTMKRIRVTGSGGPSGHFQG
ncbi:ATP-binding protein [Nonomuraea sp. NPDC047529]|uniref:ATP-binding protein n=1 Tax=Nonomuraea sp. NPDC047529 TaxID=3155623 RepID=UPI0033F0B6D0